MRVIPHDHNVMMPRRQQVNQVALKLVRVLVLVHQDKLKTALIMFAHFLMVLEQFEPQRQQIVEIHRIRRPLPRGIAFLHIGNLLRQMREIVILLRQNVRNRFVRVHREREDITEHVGFWKAGGFHIDFRFRHAGVDEVPGILPIHDREIALVTEQQRVLAQDPVANRMKCSSP